MAATNVTYLCRHCGVEITLLTLVVSDPPTWFHSGTATISCWTRDGSRALRTQAEPTRWS